MPSYLYSCSYCGLEIVSTTRADNLGPCTCSGALVQRRWSVNAQPVLQPHFNHALGEYVTSSQDFDEKLKKAGERQGTTYSRIDPGDLPRPSSDDHIFETQMKTLTDKGFTDSHGKVTLDDAGNYLPQ